MVWTGEAILWLPGGLRTWRGKGWVVSSVGWWWSLPLWSLFVVVGRSISIPQLCLWGSIWEEEQNLQINMSWFGEGHMRTFTGPLYSSRRDPTTAQVCADLALLPGFNASDSKMQRQEKAVTETAAWVITITTKTLCLLLGPTSRAEWQKWFLEWRDPGVMLCRLLGILGKFWTRDRHWFSPNLMNCGAHARSR